MAERSAWSRWWRRGAAFAAVLVVGAAAGAAVVLSVRHDGDSSATQTTTAVATSGAASLQASGSLSASEIYTRDAPGVVDITVNSTQTGDSGPFGVPFGQQTVHGEGSGFVLDKSGNIVTNAHVIDGATAIRVKFKNGATATATLVGSDDSTDVAVVHVDVAADKLTPLSFADSSTVVPGQPVVAIGSPYGLPESMSAGIVSAVERQIQAPDGSPIENAIQTDAAVNHGNSGGPLIDASGAVIGVTAQIDSSTGEGTGVGFAIPSNTVHKVATQLIAHGSVQHAYLGVQIVTIDAATAKAVGIAPGAAIVQVASGSPADKAGLTAGTQTQTYGGLDYPTNGDVVTAADGKTITTSAELRAAIEAKQPGDKIDLTVVNSGKTRAVMVTLGTRPS